MPQGPRSAKFVQQRPPVHTEESRGLSECDRLYRHPGGKIGETVRHSEECFMGTTPMGRHWKSGSGGERKGPASLPNCICLLRFAEITSGAETRRASGVTPGFDER